jgi:uncharacterized protein (DUF433 family)
MPNTLKPHGGKDLREAPLYGLTEAAHHLHLPVSTLRYWVEGKSGSAALIERPTSGDPRLSFNNLVEAHVLRALRVEHQVPMTHVRRALDYAHREFGIDRLLIREELLAAPGEVFLQEYGRLLSLSRSGQFAMEQILEAFLRRVVRDAKGLPIRLYPFTTPGIREDSRVVAIDPRISYGRPSIERKGISTAILAERLNAGESVKDLADSYELTEDEVTEAIVYESARAA